jgi:transcriptional regulator with XRE-family HTH domain
LKTKGFIGVRVRAAREAKGLSQAALGRLINRTRSLVNQWERGTSAPSVEDLGLVAAVLEVPLEHLASGEGGPLFGRPAIELPATPLTNAVVLEQILRELREIRQEIKALRAERLDKPAGDSS